MIIGLTGYMRSGKDEVAKVLTRTYGAYRYGFGDVLRAEMKERLGRTLEEMAKVITIDTGHIYTVDELLALKPTPLVRVLMQEYGTNVRREDTPDYWAIRWEHFARGWMRPDVYPRSPLVAADVRFPNELTAIRRVGGRVFRVERPDLAPDVSHESEQHVMALPVTGVIINDGSLQDLHDAVIRIVGPFLEVEHGA